jgi:transposase
MKTAYAALIGMDWGDEKHAGALQVPGAGRIEHFTLAQKAEAIDDWARALHKRFPEGKLAIVLEQSKGGLIFALMKYDFIVLYPVNPRTAAKYRQAWYPSGAKDDPTDAELLLEMLATHREKLTPWKPEPTEVRLLQRLTEQRVRLLHDLKRVGNQLTSTLKEYFPQVLELFPKIYLTIVADFLLTYSTQESAKEASEQELVAFFRAHHIGHVALTKERIAVLHSAVALTTDEAIVNSNSLFVQALARELKALNESISQYDDEIEKLYSKHNDKDLYDSLPTAGPIMAPRLLSAMGTDRSRFSTAEELANFVGISPVREQSGNTTWVHWRFACNKHLRQAFIEWSFLSMRTCFWAEEFYKSQREKGKSHNIAVRALAFKWIRIIFRMWKNKTPYSEATYLKALQKSRSHLVQALVA